MDTLLPVLKQFWVVWLMALFVGIVVWVVLAEPAAGRWKTTRASRSGMRRGTMAAQG